MHKIELTDGQLEYLQELDYYAGVFGIKSDN